MQVDNNSIIEVKDVVYKYQDNIVLDHVSFSIKAGNYVGIIGPNGGGKTTLLKILLGLIKPYSGTVKILGQPVESLKERYKIGYVPQRVSQDNISFPATVYEVVQSGRTPHCGLFSTYSKKDYDAIDSAMKIANVEKYKNRLIGDLSGGERQRVYVARSLASEPKVLFLDEPFVGIDISSQQNFYAFLKELNEKHGLTILFVSHDIDVISNEVKEIICLNRRLVCSGDSHSVMEGNIIEELYGKRIMHIHHDH